MSTLLRVLVACSLCLIMFLMGGRAMLAVSAENNYDALRRFSQVLDMVEQYYVKDVAQDELIDGALKGMLQGLDPHSSMLSKDEFKAMQESTSGEFFGVGVEITSDANQIVIISPIEDTPGHAAGLRAGDIILAIDGQVTLDMSLSDAATKMRGPKGTEVELLVLHKGEQKPVTIKVKRDAIPLISVKTKELEPGFHWVRVVRFSERTTPKLLEVLADAAKKGPIKGIVLDLRNNPGGLLDQSVSVSDAFLKQGVIVSMRGKENSQPREFMATDQGTDIDAPIVVLVNPGTASAAEIVAGALRDNKRAIIVGERTFGKGSVQNIIPLADSTGLKLTVALYYTPSGKSIQAEGIVPDFEVPWEAPKVLETQGMTLREQDLNRHLENAKDKNKSKDSAKALEDKEIQDLLKNDNQLRMGLQFVKMLPILGEIK